MYSVTRCFVAEVVRPLIDEWVEEANGEDFGLDVDGDAILADVDAMIADVRGLVLLLYLRNELIGFIGLKKFKSPLSDQQIANERYWFVSEENRGIGSMRLMKGAMEVAKGWGCSHFMANASELAGDLCEKTCKLYEKHLKMKKFETVFLKEL